MTATSLARQSTLEVTYESTNITESLRPYLKSWSFTDNLSDYSDELQLTLADKTQLWIDDWFPDKGAKVDANIKQSNWWNENVDEELPLGEFEIDEIDVSYPPSEVTIKALTVPQSCALKGENKNRSWEKTKLSVIANDIASDAGLTLYYDVSDDPEYDNMEQIEQSDLSLLMKLCKDAGLAIKVSDGKLVIFDEAAYEQADAVMTIDRETYQIKKYQGRSTLNDTYNACRIKYRSPKGKKNYDYTFTPSDPPDTERVLVLREQFDDLSEAERKAKKALREKNSQAWQFSITILADLAIFASMVVILKNFGKFDGNWLVIKATHSQSSSGHEVSMELRRCLVGY